MYVTFIVGCCSIILGTKASVILLLRSGGITAIADNFDSQLESIISLDEPFFATCSNSRSEPRTDSTADDETSSADEDDDSELFVNTNRTTFVTYQESDSESESENDCVDDDKHHE